MSRLPSSTEVTPKWRRGVFPVISALWLLAAVPGVRALMAYEHTAGRQGVSPSQWPREVPFAGDPHLPTLVVALHPRCSCSQATLAELQEAAAEFKQPYNALLLIAQPHGADYAWQNVSLYRETQQALHAQLVLDQDGRIASQFGALTSGDVRFFSAEDPASRRTLRFAGGVTGSRGMTGQNAGILALKRAFADEAQGSNAGTPATTPVFGCGLFAPPSIPLAGGKG